MAEKNIIVLEDIRRSFHTAAGEFHALKGINAKIPEGSLVILKGRSGSGKTTLLNIIGALDNPTSGKVYLDDRDMGKFSDRRKENFRRTRLGYVFQSVSLIPTMNALQNVEFSLRLAGIRRDREKRAIECLKMVGLGGRIKHMPAEMSGGEQQRVAIARAIAHRPSILLADEPTAELDSAMAAEVTKLFQEMTKKEGVTIIMTTHDVGLMDAGDMVIELEGGEQVNPIGTEAVEETKETVEE